MTEGRQRIRWKPACLRLAAALLLLAMGVHQPRAEVMTEDQVKAAYLYNFAKFVEWPTEEFSSPDAPMQFCVLDDRPIESGLNQLTKDKKIEGHPLSVATVQNAEAARDCHIVFISSTQAASVRRIIDTLHDKRALTVGETQGFLDSGGMINFVMENDHVRFEVNHRAAVKAGLHISSRLLVVAKRVIE